MGPAGGGTRRGGAAPPTPPPPPPKTTPPLREAGGGHHHRHRLAYETHFLEGQVGELRRPEPLGSHRHAEWSCQAAGLLSLQDQVHARQCACLAAINPENPSVCVWTPEEGRVQQTG